MRRSTGTRCVHTQERREQEPVVLDGKRSCPAEILMKLLRKTLCLVLAFVLFAASGSMSLAYEAKDAESASSSVTSDRMEAVSTEEETDAAPGEASITTGSEENDTPSVTDAVSVELPENRYTLTLTQAEHGRIQFEQYDPYARQTGAADSEGPDSEVTENASETKASGNVNGSDPVRSYGEEDEVVIVVHPDEGYQLTNLTFFHTGTQENYQSVDTQDTLYIFGMPACDLSVVPTFAAAKSDSEEGEIKAEEESLLDGVASLFALDEAEISLASAAAPSSITMSNGYNTDTNGNDILYVSSFPSHTLNDYAVGGAGANIRHYGTTTGADAYCLEPGRIMYSGYTSAKDHSDAWNSMSTKLKNAILITMAMGKPGNSSRLSGSAGEKYVATQVLIWELINGDRSVTTYERTNNEIYNAVFGSNGSSNKGVKTNYDAIVRAIQTLGATAAVEKAGFLASIREMLLPSAFAAEADLSGIIVKQNDATVYGDPDHQDVILVPPGLTPPSTEETPKYGYAYIKKVSSISSGTVVPGAKYTVYTNSACTSVAKTSSGSNAVFTTTAASPYSNKLTLAAGTYYVKETTAAANYQLNSKVYTLKITVDETTTLGGDGSVKDEPSPGSAYMKKVSSINSDTVVAGAKYTVYTDSACKTAAKTTDGSNAVFTTRKDSPYSNKLELDAGTYYVKETTAASGYELNPKVYTLKITSNTTTTLGSDNSVSDIPHGKLTLQKSSGNADLTDQNGCYSRKGAVYNVYSDSGCTTKVGELTTTDDGSTNTITIPAGTYYVKEKTASPGYMLCNGQLGDGANASGVHTVNVTAGKTATVSCKEPPLNHPFALILQKMDAETKQPTAAGTASLEGALFQIDYYANTDGTATGTPFHTWVFQTDEKGRLDCSDESCLVKDRSDALYRDVDGKIVYPLGTYTVKEIQAPRYYQLAGTMKFANRSEEAGVTEGLKLVIVQGNDGKAQIVSGGSTITAENLSIDAYDKVYKGKIRVVKYDTDGKTPLAGVRFRLVGDDGSEYEGTSDRNGNVLFENLIPQHYVLTEISTVDGHMLLKENIDITIPLEMTEKEAEEQGTDISKAVWDEAAGVYCFYEITYEVANATKLVIPVAGGTPGWLYVSMILAFVLIGGGMTAFRRSRVKSRN